MPVLRPLVWVQTSLSFSSTAMRSLYRESSRAMALPTTPPPMMTTS